MFSRWIRRGSVYFSDVNVHHHFAVPDISSVSILLPRVSCCWHTTFTTQLFAVKLTLESGYIKVPLSLLVDMKVTAIVWNRQAEVSFMRTSRLRVSDNFIQIFTKTRGYPKAKSINQTSWRHLLLDLESQRTRRFRSQLITSIHWEK